MAPQATGTLAEIQGPRALLPDVGARLLRFRGDMKRELNHYHPRGYEIVTAFVAGINAYIELTEREPARLPLEFRILGIKPGKWTPEVVVSRHNGLFRNVTQEVQYAQLVHLVGSDRAREFLNLHPGHPLLKPDRVCRLVPDWRPCPRYLQGIPRGRPVPSRGCRAAVSKSGPPSRKTAALAAPDHGLSRITSPGG